MIYKYILYWVNCDDNNVIFGQKDVVLAGFIFLTRHNTSGYPYDVMAFFPEIRTGKDSLLLRDDIYRVEVIQASIGRVFWHCV